MPRTSKRTVDDLITSSPTDKSIVQSLIKGFRVLEAFTEDFEDLTLSEIAELASLDPGTTFRLLNTLTNMEYIRRDPRTRRFSLTLKVLDLGFNAIGRRDIRTVARPVLRRLVGKVSEAVSFAILEGTDVFYIERVRAGLVRLGVDIRIGTTIPAHISIIGQSILAFLSESELKLYATASQSIRHDFRDKCNINDILPALKKTREKGYLLGPSTLTEGLNILAVPVLDCDGFPIGAVSVAAPSTRCTIEILSEMVEETKLAAREIARAIEVGGSSISIS